MTTYELLSLAVAFIGTTFVGTSILLLSKQVKIAVNVHADNHDWNRRIETQHAITKIRELNIDSLNEKFGYLNRHEPIPLEEVKDAFKEDQSLQLLLHKVLNFYEGLANGVYLGTFDEKIIKVNRKGTMQRELSRFKYYIEYQRNSGNKQNAWAGYERLINKWNSATMENNDLEKTGQL
jgi:hypothetical protein